ncbi:MAG: Uma2 family endonuclease [Gemmatimonadaceae bacterium]|nr:Uma2 family endonuclease [Gemmatimonadaceae bacterium]
MAAPKEFWTVQDVYDLPDDGNRYETVNGELLVTPGPGFAHQLIAGALYAELRAYLAKWPVGVPLYGPAEATKGDVTRVQPDVFVASNAWRAAKRYGAVAELLLVAEVLSPSSRRGDRFTKRVEFQRQGVPLYWLIDPDARTVEARRPGSDFAEPVADALEWWPAGAGEAFRLSLRELFADLDQ